MKTININFSDATKEWLLNVFIPALNAGRLPAPAQEPTVFDGDRAENIEPAPVDETAKAKTPRVHFDWGAYGITDGKTFASIAERMMRLDGGDESCLLGELRFGRKSDKKTIAGYINSHRDIIETARPIARLKWDGPSDQKPKMTSASVAAVYAWLLKRGYGNAGLGAFFRAFVKSTDEYTPAVTLRRRIARGEIGAGDLCNEFIKAAKISNDNRRPEKRI